MKVVLCEWIFNWCIWRGFSVIITSITPTLKGICPNWTAEISRFTTPLAKSICSDCTKVFLTAAAKYLLPQVVDKTKAALQGCQTLLAWGFEPKCKINVGIFTFGAKCNLSTITVEESSSAASLFYCIKFWRWNEPPIVWMGLPMQQAVDLLKRLLLFNPN